jgi:hypothetical protein
VESPVCCQGVLCNLLACVGLLQLCAEAKRKCSCCIALHAYLLYLLLQGVVLRSCPGCSKPAGTRSSGCFCRCLSVQLHALRHIAEALLHRCQGCCCFLLLLLQFLASTAQLDV